MLNNQDKVFFPKIITSEAVEETVEYSQHTTDIILMILLFFNEQEAELSNLYSIMEENISKKISFHLNSNHYFIS